MARGSHWWNEPPRWARLVMVLGVAALAVCLPLALDRGRLPAEAVEQLHDGGAEPTPAQVPLRVAFLGDSWTEGTGADTPDGGYAPLTARALGWTPTLMGQGGTGYTTGAEQGAAYFERVADVIAAAPDIVVVQGSTNDFAVTQAELTTAVGAVLDGLRAGLPDAEVVTLGAFFTPRNTVEQIELDQAAVEAASAARQIHYIDPTGWLDASDDSLWADGFHPNQQGHRRIAALLAPLLLDQVS